MKKSINYRYSFKAQVCFNFLLITFFVVFSSFLKQENKESFKEKIYVQLDKPNYYAGEDIWFKTYLLNAATHAPETLSKLVYVV